MWNMTIGVGFHVRCGVRQGGVLSPFLFAIYIDDIIVQMRNPGLGIRIGSRPIFAGCLLYADDIVVISYSYYGLQKLTRNRKHHRAAAKIGSMRKTTNAVMSTLGSKGKREGG